MELVDLLLSSKENLLAASQIAISVYKAKSKIVNKLFDSIKSKLDKDNIKYIEDNNKSLIGINIPFLKKRECGISVDTYIRIEIDQYLYIGYCCTSNGLNNKELITPSEVVKYINPTYHCKLDHTSWWIYKEFILDENNEDTFEFKNFNTNAYKLLDDKYLDSLCNRGVIKIKEMLEKKC